MTIEERLIAIEQRRKEDQQFRDNLIEEIANKYDFGRAIAKACVDKGWENGHAYGYSEVRARSQIAADFAKEILRFLELLDRYNYEIQY